LFDRDYAVALIALKPGISDREMAASVWGPWSPSERVAPTCRFLAANRDEPGAEGDLIKGLWSLREIDGVLVIRWRLQAGFERFAATVVAAWKASGGEAAIHFVSTEPEPVLWSEGVDPKDDRYLPYGVTRA